MLGITFLLALGHKHCVSESNDILFFWGSFFVKLSYLFYRFYYKYGGNLSSPTLSTDAKRFWHQAELLYTGVAVNPETRFPYLLNIEFHFFGQNLFCVLLFNIFLTLLMMIIVIYLLNQLEVKGRDRLIALGVTALLPYEMIVANSVLRESIYFIFITLSFATYYHYVKSGRYKYLILSTVVLLPVIILHTGYFAILIVYYFDSFRHNKVKSNSDMTLRICLFCVFLVFIMLSVRMDTGGGGYMSRGVSGIINKLTGDTEVTSYADEAGSRYLSSLKIHSIPTLIIFTPIRWIYFLFSPLPTNWRGLTDILAFLMDGCIHLFVIYSLLKSRKLMKVAYDGSEVMDEQIRLVELGLGIIAFVALVFCLNTNTAGTAIRHRDVLIGIEAVLMGFSLKMKKNYIEHEAKKQ